MLFRSSVMRLVVVEEMLHLTLVANIINAIGGDVDLTVPGFVPEYPTHLPDGETDFEVEVLRLCPEAIETFMRIERPGEKGADRDHVARHRSPRALVPHFRHHAGHDLHFFSIGEFYAEIERGLKALEQALAATGETLFTGDPARQARPGDYFQDTGPLGTVTDLESALLAIDFITEQGEGLGDRIYGEFGELGHTLSKPKVDDIAMMVPPPAASMIGVAVSIAWTSGMRSSSRLCCHCSAPLSEPPVTLETRMSRPPRAAAASVMKP